MALKIIVVVFAVFCLIPANGNIIIKSAEEGEYKIVGSLICPVYCQNT